MGGGAHAGLPLDPPLTSDAANQSVVMVSLHWRHFCIRTEGGRGQMCTAKNFRYSPVAAGGSNHWRKLEQII